MKTGVARFKAGLLGLMLGGSPPMVVAAGIGFSISPPVITNNYVGQITFLATNLTPGMTVTVDEIADVDSNGIIDAGDLPIAGFQLTDGQTPLVGGIRNLNVPGDDDGLMNGQILVHYDYPDVGGGLWSGRIFFRVSDPTGNLTAATQALTVVQYVYPQAVIGRATIAGTGAPLTNCLLGMVSSPSETMVAATDTNGNYVFYGLPPSYVIFGLNQQGAIFNEFQVVSLSCGQISTNNVVVSKGNFSIGGRVTDSGTGAGVPGLQLDANTPDGFDLVSFTDTNGNYSLEVTPDTWRVHPSTGAPAARGYVDPPRTSVTVTNANVSGVNFSLSKATALIYGTVQDTLGNPVFGIQVSTRDSADIFRAVGRSFANNGSYTIGVLANTWYSIALNAADLSLQGFASSNAYNVTLMAGQTTNLNFVVIRTNFPSLTKPVHVSGSQFQFLLNGLAGQPYTVQTVTNLGSTNWLALLTTNAPCSSVFILDRQATNGQRFYRTLVVPW
jgi:hypothetical protein